MCVPYLVLTAGKSQSHMYSNVQPYANVQPRHLPACSVLARSVCLLFVALFRSLRSRQRTTRANMGKESRLRPNALESLHVHPTHNPTQQHSEIKLAEHGATLVGETSSRNNGGFCSARCVCARLHVRMQMCACDYVSVCVCTRARACQHIPDDFDT